uniref:G_PROTEIN_RECEP_F1_2 domain-containing protein n=1 Tax=Steinernema glaseri TaxID=37863 RepID=A0A1I7YGK9_9BILA
MSAAILSPQHLNIILMVVFIIIAVFGFFTLLHIALCTPGHMRHYGYFLLNINFWFYLTALLSCVKYTEIMNIDGKLCFEIHMIITVPLLSSIVYSIFSVLSLFCSYLAILLTFIFLMLRVVLPQFLHKIRSWMGLLVVVVIQFGISGFMAFITTHSFTPSSGPQQVLCVTGGDRFFTLIVISLTQIVIVSVLLIVIIVIIVKKMKIQKVSQQTRKLQRMLLKTLVITALIPILFKSIPSLVASVALVKQWPELMSIQILTSLLTPVQAIANGIATLLCVRCYREKLWKLTTFWRQDNYKVFNVVSTFGV